MNRKLNNKIFKKKIHHLIPGGAHTYSKGDDVFPEIAPAAIKYGKGVYVWDLDNNKYLDWCMGLTSVSIGHAFEVINKKVFKEITLGTNFQRPSYIELEFAEFLKSIMPNMEMFKFGKNGSTLTTAAVKLARSYTGRDMVAVCGDHPFFSYDDWFIGTTTCNAGIPKSIQKLTVRFKYDDNESLKKLFDRYPKRIAAVILEPYKFYHPKNNFLQNLKKLCRKNGAVFILDEMVSGFRYEFPAINVVNDLDPDLVTYGKGIANGFSAAVLAGKKEIMEYGGIAKKGMERVFLASTTHGAETHSIRAAIETIKYLESHNIIEKNRNKGEIIKRKVRGIIDQYKLKDYVYITDIPQLLFMGFKDEQKKESMAYTTYFRQEMLKRGILFQGLFTLAAQHTRKEIEFTLSALEECMGLYRKALENKNVNKLLVGEPIKPVFRKYI